MAKYLYPEIFTSEKDETFPFFPDLEGCYTCGDTLEGGLEMTDVLALVLYGYEKDRCPILVPFERCSPLPTEKMNLSIM